MFSTSSLDCLFLAPRFTPFAICIMPQAAIIKHSRGEEEIKYAAAKDESDYRFISGRDIICARVGN